MKTKLLLLFTLITTLSFAQTFDWETATLNGSNQNPNSGASQVINGQYFVGFNTPNLTPILLDTAGQGSSGLSVRNQQNETSVQIGMNESVGPNVYGLDVQSIKVFAVGNNQNWTFKSLDASGNVLNTTTANVGQNAVVVNLNWTNVFLIEITLTNGASTNFGVDDIVFTPCVVNIPDSNFKAALVNNTAINTNGDTEIQCSEATAFNGVIDVTNESISDLTGIEAFTNITELYCGFNLLTSIDISANVALTLFACISNSLTNLDVSTNLALTELYCGNNLLTSLDVSNNTLLERLSCQNNALITLDITSNSLINYFECQVNALTSLNVANGNNTAMTMGRFFAASNPNLACIQVDNEAFSLANWSQTVDATTTFSTDCAALSIDEFNQNTVGLYPNPTTSVLNIKMNNSLKQATIYSVLGKAILKTQSNTINTSRLKSGMYLITIEDKTGASTTKRFIKQ